MGDDEQNPASPAEDGQGIAFNDPWVGQFLGDYFIMRRIGEGGMGIVYLARHQSLDRLAAVKFLGAHMVDDKAYIDRFLNEARGAAKLNHPNIVSVYDAGVMGENIYYFIMEYIEGRDLGSLLRELKVFPVPTAVDYMRQAAAALGYAHRRKIIHRDIKPDNFMLTNDGTIKVGDLGLAKWIEDDSGGGMTQSGVVMGTPFYISPEQVRGARDVDWRADIYSLGATLFHMVTGRIPYEGSSPAVIMAKHLNEPPPEPSAVNPTLDSGICAVIRRMMAKAPEDRFQTMEDVDRALSDHQQGRLRAPPIPMVPDSQLPKTEPQLLPSAPPQRAAGSPAVYASEPGAWTKVAAIIGASMVIASVIIGFFIASAFRQRAQQRASTAPVQPPPNTQPAAGPAASLPKPVEIRIPTEEKPAVVQPAPHAAQPPEPASSSQPPVIEPPPAVAAPGNLEPAEEPPAAEMTSARSLLEPGAAEAPTVRPEAREEVDMMLMMPDGGFRPISEEGRERFQAAARASPPVYQLDPGQAPAGRLPAGVECFLLDEATHKSIDVGRSGLKTKTSKVFWSQGREGDGHDRDFLRLTREDKQPSSTLFGARLQLPRLEPVMHLAGFMLRSPTHTHGKLLQPTGDSRMPFVLRVVPLEDRWKLVLLPMAPRRSSKSQDNVLNIALRESGQLDIGGVKVFSISDPLKRALFGETGPTNPAAARDEKNKNWKPLR